MRFLKQIQILLMFPCILLGQNNLQKISSLSELSAWKNIEGVPVVIDLQGKLKDGMIPYKELMKLRNIYRIDLSHNELRNLNDSIFYFSRVPELRLVDCNISDFPLPKDTFSVERLFLDFNKIDGIPRMDLYKNLKTLSLSYCKVKTWDEKWCDTKLHELYLSGNPISEYKICRFISLKLLEVANTPISKRQLKEIKNHNPNLTIVRKIKIKHKYSNSKNREF